MATLVDDGIDLACDVRILESGGYADIVSAEDVGERMRHNSYGAAVEFESHVLEDAVREGLLLLDVVLPVKESFFLFGDLTARILHLLHHIRDGLLHAVEQLCNLRAVETGIVSVQESIVEGSSASRDGGAFLLQVHKAL